MTTNTSESKLIPFPSLTNQKSARLLAPPETRWMKAGLVHLRPGESIGLHSTGGGEEIILPISGAGEVRYPGAEMIRLRAGFMVYNPPDLEHDVVNTGFDTLVYVYVVANQEQVVSKIT